MKKLLEIGICMKYIHTKSRVQNQLHLEEKKAMYFMHIPISSIFFHKFTKNLDMVFTGFYLFDGFHRIFPPHLDRLNIKEQART